MVGRPVPETRSEREQPSSNQARTANNRTEVPEISPDLRTATTMYQIMLANKVALRDALERYDEASPPVIGSKRVLKNMQRQLDHIASSEKDSNLRYYTWAPLDSKNVRELLGTIRGPKDTPYHNGIFHIRISLEDSFPMTPPICWFLTKIYHPNIDSNGAICLDVLRENYSPALNLDSFPISICSLLDTPGTDDPLVPEIAAQFLNQREEFDKTAREWTNLYATGEIIYRGDREDGFYNTTG